MTSSLERPPPIRPDRPRRRSRVWLAASASALVTAAVAVTIVLVTAPGSPRSRSAAMIPKRTAADHGLDALPFPGTPDASPSAQITFPALLPSELKSVTVTGSSSGRHAGRLLALPGRRGTAFVPHRKFSAGEHVTVKARLSFTRGRHRHRRGAQNGGELLVPGRSSRAAGDEVAAHRSEPRALQAGAHAELSLQAGLAPAHDKAHLQRPRCRRYLG